MFFERPTCTHHTLRCCDGDARPIHVGHQHSTVDGKSNDDVLQKCITITILYFNTRNVPIDDTCRRRKSFVMLFVCFGTARRYMIIMNGRTDAVEYLKITKSRNIAPKITDILFNLILI